MNNQVQHNLERNSYTESFIFTKKNHPRNKDNFI